MLSKQDKLKYGEQLRRQVCLFLSLDEIKIREENYGKYVKKRD